MSARNPNNSSDFESRYFTMLHDRMDKQDRTLDQILAQTKKTNGRVNKLEYTVYTSVPKQKDLPKFLQDPIVVRIIVGFFLVVAVAFLLFVAYLTGTNLGDLRGLI